MAGGDGGRARELRDGLAREGGRRPLDDVGLAGLGRDGERRGLGRGDDDRRRVGAVDDLHVLAGHGLRTRRSWSAPDSITAVVTVPDCTCTWILDWCCRWTVPSASQPLGIAGAIRSSPS